MRILYLFITEYIASMLHLYASCISTPTSQCLANWMLQNLISGYDHVLSISHRRCREQKRRDICFKKCLFNIGHRKCTQLCFAVFILSVLGFNELASYTYPYNMVMHRNICPGLSKFPRNIDLNLPASSDHFGFELMRDDVYHWLSPYLEWYICTTPQQNTEQGPVSI